MSTPMTPYEIGNKIGLGFLEANGVSLETIAKTIAHAIEEAVKEEREACLQIVLYYSAVPCCSDDECLTQCTVSDIKCDIRDRSKQEKKRK